MRYSLLCCFFLGTVPVFATPNPEKPADSTPSEKWEKFAAEKKELTNKTFHLKEKREECIRLAAEKQKKIKENQEKIQKCLPLLLRVGRTHSLRFLVDLKATKSSVRGVILLRAVASSLAHRIKKAQADLHELIAFITDLEGKGHHLQTHAEELQTQHNALQEKSVQVAEDLKAMEEARLSEITVHNLLEESQATLSKTKPPSPQSKNSKDFPFSRLEPPVAGKLVKDPALQKKFSPQSQGAVFQTEKSASVHAPAKGKVVFKGPFLSQGDILILDHGHHVHTVYMGMEKITVDMGQDLYAGEKIGVMPGYGKGQPLLYLELRQKGKTLDPFPYLGE